MLSLELKFKHFNSRGGHENLCANNGGTYQRTVFIQIMTVPQSTQENAQVSDMYKS